MKRIRQKKEKIKNYDKNASRKLFWFWNLTHGPNFRTTLYEIFKSDFNLLESF